MTPLDKISEQTLADEFMKKVRAECNKTGAGVPVTKIKEYWDKKHPGTYDIIRGCVRGLATYTLQVGDDPKIEKFTPSLRSL